MDARKRLILPLAALALLAVIAACHGRGKDTGMAQTDSLKTELESRDWSVEEQDSIATRGMKMSVDSLDYYYFQSFRTPTQLLRTDYRRFDSLQAAAKRFCAWQKPSPRVNDLMSRYFTACGVYSVLTYKEDSAFANYQKALSYQTRGSRPRGIPNILINFSDAYIYKSDYANASSCLRRALFLADSIGGMNDLRIRAISGLAAMYVGLRNFVEAEKYFRMGDRMVKYMHGRQKIFFYISRGNYYYFKEDYPATLSQFKFILANRNNIEMTPFDVNLTYINLSDAYIKNGCPDSALIYQKLCRPFFERNKIDVALYYLTTQKIAIALQHNDLRRVRRLLDDPKAIATRESEQIYMRYKYLLDYYSRIGDNASALHYSECINHINDSLRNERTRLATAETEMRYRQDKRAMGLQLSLANSESQLQFSRLVLLVCILLLLLLAVTLITFSFYASARRKRTLAEQKQRLLKMRMESLRSRVSPHFIFNVLNYEMYNKSQGKATTDIPVLVKLIRRGLEQTDELSTSLSDELDFVDGYVQLQSKALGDNFTFDEQIADDVDLDTVRLPSMMMQIAVENAIKHGLRGLDRDKLLAIQISRRDEGTSIRIIDNGRGLAATAASAAESTGTGTRVIDGLLEMLNERNSRKLSYRLDNNAEGQGCLVEIFLPDDYDYSLD